MSNILAVQKNQIFDVSLVIPKNAVTGEANFAAAEPVMAKTKKMIEI
jgi:hypothetical protein